MAILCCTMTQWLGHWTGGHWWSLVRRQSLHLYVMTLMKLVAHTRAAVTEQYNLILVNGRWCSATGRLVESNGSLLLGVWLKLLADWLPRNRDQHWPHSSSSVGLPLPYVTVEFIKMLCQFGSECHKMSTGVHYYVCTAWMRSERCCCNVDVLHCKCVFRPV